MIAYFDCMCGISGDMMLGAFIDLGVPVDFIENKLRQIQLPDFSLQVEHVTLNGIRAVNVHVNAGQDEIPGKHFDIRALLDNVPLSKETAKRSIAVFDRLAEAEESVQGISEKHVQINETGSMIPVIEIVGCSLCMEYLKISSVAASRIPLGSGFTETRHGLLPVPSPATFKLLQGIPVYGTDIEKELVTPSGAAFVSTLSRHFGSFPQMKVQNTGYGAGKGIIQSRPNLLRIVTGHSQPETDTIRTESICVIETSIDDMNPEFCSYLMEKLFEAGALDVCWIPVYMKKNRPGVMIHIVCRHETKDALTLRIFRETTSTGVRTFDLERRILPREAVNVKTRFGAMPAKKITGPDGLERIVPEYEACRKLAVEKNVPLREIYESVAALNTGTIIKGERS